MSKKFKDRICEICDMEYTPNGPSQKYCKKCSSKKSKERKHKWYIKNTNHKRRKKYNKFCVACGEKAVSKFDEKWYCNKHWLRMYNNGTLEKKKRKRTNKYIIDGDTGYVITANKTKIIVDSKYINKLKKHSWCISVTGYPVANINNKTIKMHLFLFGKADGNLVNDHINRNKLDNRRSNIRQITNTENSRNCNISKNNKSGYNGITIMPNGKYRARITVNRKEIHLGTYKNLDEAIKARNKGEEKYW